MELIRSKGRSFRERQLRLPRHTVVAILDVMKRAEDVEERLRLQAQAAIAMMFFGGLRPGEARGARWEHYSGKTLTVKQSVWRKHTTDPKTANAKKPVPVIEPLRGLLAQLHQIEGNPGTGPILRGGKGGPLDLNMLAKRVIRPALRNRKNYRDGESKDWKRLSGKPTIRSVEESQRS